MWTTANRDRYNRDHLRYPSDLTDEEWSLIGPLIPPAKRGRNMSTTLIHPGSEFKLVSRPSAGIAQGQGRYPAFVPDPAG